MDRRKLLMAFIAAPVAAIIPASAVAVAAKPVMATLTPKVVGEVGWQRIIFTGATGEDTIYAVHPNHDVAIGLDQMWDGELPDDETLDYWVVIDKEDQRRIARNMF